VTLLIASGLTKSFGGVRAIDDVSLTFERGAVHSIIGPNGAGKTTLINISAASTRPTPVRSRSTARTSPAGRCTRSPPPASDAPSRTCRCSST
jgi:ABC-type branched-subunit amino acid transport system ATPase component